MKRMSDQGDFKPKQSRLELKSDAITISVRKIVESETAARNAKTERLRAARLARDAKEPVKAKKKRTVSTK